MIGRFISADTIIPHPLNPQSFNRYSYCMNNPLKYIDPSGNEVEVAGMNRKRLPKHGMLVIIYGLLDRGNDKV